MYNSDKNLTKHLAYFGLKPKQVIRYYYVSSKNDKCYFCGLNQVFFIKLSFSEISNINENNIDNTPQNICTRFNDCIETNNFRKALET